MRSIATILLFALAASAATAVEPQRYAVVGRGLVFAFAEPTGWKMDTESGMSDGLPVVFYPIGRTWASAETVMYANTAPKDCEPSHDLGGFVSRDLKQTKERNPQVIVEDAASTKADGYQVLVKKLKGDRTGNIEAIAYIDSQNTFVSVVLSTKSQDDFEANYPVFRALVESFQQAASSNGCAP